MKRLLIVAALTSGCDSIFDLEPVVISDGGGGSGSDDAGPDDDAMLPCFGGNEGGFVSICLQPGDDDEWVETTDIDTGVVAGACEQIVAHEGENLCVFAAQNITITQPINVRGNKPLVLVATQTLTIDGSLFANSTVGRRGPGANPSVCVPGNAPSQTAAGAAGGTHGTPGGDGGTADNSGGIAGVAQPVSTEPVTTLRGGCQGGAVGSELGGDGGGAMYLIAGGVIALNNATLDVSGEKGLGGGTLAGGAGGGAGGMIVLDAPMIAIQGSTIVANGAGGGGGGGTNGKGEDGFERNLGFADYGAPGGPGGDLGGGSGGAGADLDSDALNGEGGTETTAGGGGGGGGHGRILLFGNRTISTTVFSPPLP